MSDAETRYDMSAPKANKLDLDALERELLQSGALVTIKKSAIKSIIQRLREAEANEQTAIEAHDAARRDFQRAEARIALVEWVVGDIAKELAEDREWGCE